MGGTRDTRQVRRFDARFDVGLLGDLLDGRGRLVDLSTGGCRLRSSEGMQPNGYLHLFLRSPHAAVPVKVELASIRWANRGEFGLEFFRVHPEQQKRLRDLVNTLQIGAGFAPIRSTRSMNHRNQDPEDLLHTLYSRWG